MFEDKSKSTLPPELHDFRNLLYVIWRHLNLPDPTPVQYNMAEFLQNAPKRAILEAFRGVGKSYVSCAYVCWCLAMDPDFKIMVVSASKARADDFSTFVQRLIMEVPCLQHLIAGKDQRWSKIAFDIAPAKASGSPSVKSVGISGQLTGSRANLILADDVEIPSNSLTQGMRDKLAEQIKEFEAVLSPNGKIMYLGTPQCEMSLYNVLIERGYQMRIWPARVPSAKKAEKAYGERLAPMIWDRMHEEGDASEGLSVDPKRFDDKDLTERELSYGRSGFALQFMLDTSLADADRYPLKMSDLMIMSVDRDKMPEKLVYGRLKQIKDLPNVGLSGDKLFAPEAVVGDYVDFDGSVLVVDPSGRGSDETSYAVVKNRGGTLYVPECGGLDGGYDEPTLTKICEIAKTHKVNVVLIESNFGDGMYNQLLTPYMRDIYPVTMEEVRHSKQKELRIIDTLEPVMNQHRLVIDPKVIQSDYDSVQKYPIEQQSKYMLMYQMTRLTKERGSLAHDDRLDALAMGVAYWTEQMAADVDLMMRERRDEMMQDELNRFMDGANMMASSRSTTWT